MMKITLYSAQPYEIEAFKTANRDSVFDIHFVSAPVSAEGLKAAAGSEAISLFVNDRVDLPLLEQMAGMGIKIIALRCVGFDNIDLTEAARCGIHVLHTEYAPHTVAEHTIALLLTLARNLHRALHRTQQGNFSLGGLSGRQLYGKTAGVIGSGHIGVCTVKMLQGLGMQVIVSDPHPATTLDASIEYVTLEELYPRADAILLHCPLLPSTTHLINASTLAQMKPGAFIVNTSRGKLINTHDLLEALDQGRLGGIAMDVYENEAALFFSDHSSTLIPDPHFYALAARHNVIITGHQAFLTQETLQEIAVRMLDNLEVLHDGRDCSSELTAA